MDLFPFLIIGIFLVVFPLLWSGIVWMIATIGGWGRLAKLYRTDRPPDPEARTFRMTSGAIGASRYNGVLRVDAQPDGLRLAVIAPFRPGHPPILIPWGEIVSVERRQILFTTAYQLTVGDPQVATLTLPEKVIEAMRDVLPSAGDVEGAFASDGFEDTFDDEREARRSSRRRTR